MALSKEEKKAKKEAKRLEKLRADAEARKEFKRKELQREMKAQSLKRDELDRTWREMMLKIKEPILIRDTEVMWHCFERTFDKKDHLIKYTLYLMNVADDQVSRTIASFCVTIDTMINKFLKDLDDLSNDNDCRTAELLKRGEDDASRIMYDHNAAETHLQLLLYHAHTTADADAWTNRGENLVKQDEERIKYFNDRENLRSFLEDIYNTVWDDYKAVLRAYVVNTAENQKKVRRLRHKEVFMADIIAAQGRRIANSDTIIKTLRSELQQYESGTKQAVFRDRRNRHRAACARLKQDLVHGCASDEQQLARLVRLSDDAVEWLEKAQKKGEKILRLASLCRRFETQKEKVLPFGCTLPHSATKIDESKTKPQDSLIINAISSTSGMNRLWQRIAKAELTRRALYREKCLLEQENKVLLSQIQEYGEEPIIPTTTTCICDKINSNKQKLQTSRPVAIDGALALKKYNYRKF